MEKNSHYFYVLECRDGTFYAGYTNNIKQRITKHNQGKGAKYTRGRGPVELLFAKEFITKSEALKAEIRFKKFNRKQKENFLIREVSEIDVAAEEFSKK
ncbi:GIY-YIG nuclease family protein [Cytobacillus sp. S13-E01]|uniref:GIY-YIG nuclease family protein n=1 Tax=Cytobacillus sp. S13-E01 TaxID=3031326 RepID=UPI0023D7D8B4|nr:GIY-YIG nuclease family protein [Cytobacillus sp. S13-E01]MDF0727849.1 GIY-YIG nuclease family protein [Cytobacillus sp. S13-E01]